MKYNYEEIIKRAIEVHKFSESKVCKRFYKYSKDIKPHGSKMCLLDMLLKDAKNKHMDSFNRTLKWGDIMVVLDHNVSLWDMVVKFMRPLFTWHPDHFREELYNLMKFKQDEPNKNLKKYMLLYADMFFDLKSCNADDTFTNIIFNENSYTLSSHNLAPVDDVPYDGFLNWLDKYDKAVPDLI